MNYSHIIMEAARLMKISSPTVSPSGIVPKKDSKWDRFRIGAYGGRRIFPGLAPRILEYMGINRPEIRANRASGGLKAWSAPSPGHAP